MSERPGHGPSDRRRPHHSPGDRQRQAAGDAPSDSLVEMRGIQALEHLRERIQTAANEILRLREENAALAERIARLESRTGANIDSGTILQLDEDPEAIRRKVSSFIEAIDQYLKSDQT